MTLELNTNRNVWQAILDGHEVEVKGAISDEWVDLKSVHIQLDLLDNNTDGRFRLKPTKPSIDWSHVHPRYNYLVRDSDGRSYLLANRPIPRCEFWDVGWEVGFRPDVFKSFKPGTCDWQDSLVERPKD